MRYRVAVPLGVVALVTVLVVFGGVGTNMGTATFWALAFFVGLVFLVQYSVKTHWWRRHSDPLARALAQFQREIVAWTFLIVFSAGIATATAVWGSSWVPRDGLRYVLAAASFLVVFRRYALYLRTRRGERADLAQAITDAINAGHIQHTKDGGL